MDAIEVKGSAMQLVSCKNMSDGMFSEERSRLATIDSSYPDFCSSYEKPLLFCGYVVQSLSGRPIYLKKRNKGAHFFSVWRGREYFHEVYSR